MSGRKNLKQPKTETKDNHKYHIAHHIICCLDIIKAPIIYYEIF